MGEIADMMLDGTLDEQTGEYLGEAVGYSRTIQPGYYNSINKKRNVKNVKLGLKKFISKTNLDFKEVIEEYWFQVLNNKPTRVNQMCVIIQKDFESFRKWFDKNKR